MIFSSFSHHFTDVFPSFPIIFSSNPRFSMVFPSVFGPFDIFSHGQLGPFGPRHDDVDLICAHLSGGQLLQDDLHQGSMLGDGDGSIFGRNVGNKREE